MRHHHPTSRSPQHDVEGPATPRSVIYLCGSIGDRTIEEAIAWRERATDLLAPELGVLSPLRDVQRFRTLDPQHRIEARETSHLFTDAEIVERDLSDIRRSFLVLRHYLGPSEGSPMECAYAK